MTEQAHHTSAELLDLAGRLAGEVRAAGLRFAFLGGIAVLGRSPDLQEPVLERCFSDLDAFLAEHPERLEALLAGLGWEPDREFNLYQGQSRLLFYRQDGQGRAALKLDVFVGEFVMCHRFRLASRVPAGDCWLYPADLLLTKLQIHEANEKDLLDSARLFLACPATADDSGLNLAYIAGLCRSDWGLQHTLELNLRKTLDWATAALSDQASALVRSRIDELRRVLDATPKTGGWKLRAALGEKIRWYQDVEEVER